MDLKRHLYFKRFEPSPSRTQNVKIHNSLSTLFWSTAELGRNRDFSAYRYRLQNPAGYIRWRALSSPVLSPLASRWRRLHRVWFFCSPRSKGRAAVVEGTGKGGWSSVPLLPSPPASHRPVSDRAQNRRCRARGPRRRGKIFLRFVPASRPNLTADPPPPFGLSLARHTFAAHITHTLYTYARACCTACSITALMGINWLNVRILNLNAEFISIELQF